MERDSAPDAPKAVEDVLRDRLLQLGYKSRRSPNDIDLLKEMVEICERLDDEEEAAELRRRICRIDPHEQSIQGKAIAQRKPLVKIPDSIDVPYWKDLDRLKRYPLMGFGRTVVIGGTFFLAFGRYWAWFAVNSIHRPFGLFPASFILLAFWGFVLSYWLNVADRSAQGEDEPPDWTDFRDFFHSMLGPFLGVLICLASSFGPAIVWGLLCVDPFGFNALTVPVLIALCLLGLYWAPMTFLVYTRFKTVSAAIRYPFVWAAIRKVRPDYLVMLVPLGVLVLANILVGGVFGLMAGIPRVGLIIYLLGPSFVWFYSGIIAFHMLGRFYLRHREKLNWFDEVLEAATSNREES